MLDQVLNIFGIEPDIDLNLMKPMQDLFDVTSSIIVSMRDVFQSINQILYWFMVIQQQP